VARFRHRQGELRLVEIEIAAPALERWAAPRLRGLVGARTPDVWVRVRPGAATVCVAEVTEPDRSATSPAPVIAFDVHLLPRGEDLTLVVESARGADLPAPATALAVACVEALLGGIAEREGAAFFVRDAAAVLAKALLPEAGARAPSADGVRWKAVSADGSSWILQAEKDATGAAPTEDAVLASEAASALRDADEALLAGAPEDARDGYLSALERSPRHPEIVRRLLEIDTRAGGRAEAALALLGELPASARPSRFGVAPGALLLQRGDRDAALAYLERAGEQEEAPALAAKAFEVAAREAPEAETALRLLDVALARAPRSCPARWARVERRLAVGRLEEATADLEHLEALARGPRAKHSVWMRAGRAWRAAGLAGRAAAVFERALRYVPDEPGALAGLGVALVAEGRASRGVELLVRALELAETSRAGVGGIALDLARSLAVELDDLPSAVARAAAVPPDAPEAVLARGLEGRGRARRGDVVGAGLAFARMRDRLAAHASPEAPPGSLHAEVIGLLQEAAHLELETRGDPVAAQRYLAEALRIRPRDEALRRAYRDVGARIAGRPAAPFPPATPVAEPALDDEARVEELTRRFHAAPADDGAADELASLLEKLDRGHELLALLSARIEDATPERRSVLAPRARAALERLATQAAKAGREAEADLFRSAAAGLS
jgi:tetratricopeptide (TPR) repeat protein